MYSSPSSFKNMLAISVALILLVLALAAIAHLGYMEVLEAPTVVLPGPGQILMGRVTEYAVSAELTADPKKLRVREEITLDRWSVVQSLSADDIKEMFDADTIVLTQLASSDGEVLVISATVGSHPVTLALPIQEKHDVVTVLQEREVASTDHGFLLREASVISPSLRWGVSEANLAGVDILFVDRCDSVKVDVTLPANSFHDAQHAVNIQRNRYVDTETITWTLDDLRHGVIFSYVPPPYNDSPIPESFFGLGSTWGWVVAIVGLIAAALAIPIIGPALVSFIQSRITSWMEARSRNEPKDTARLVVSGTGEEKEIEID